MANNYLQFSEVLARLTESEEAWLEEQLQPICVFGGKEYLEDDVPAEFADAEADWSGVRFMRDKPDNEWDELGFDYCFDENEDWGRHLWLYAEECGDVDNAAWLAHKFLKEFRPQACWSLTYAAICSKPRVGEFGGGAIFVTANEIKWQNAYGFIDQQKAAFERKEAVYVSVWDDAITCRSACKFHPTTRRVSDIEMAENQKDAESSDSLTDEYVEVDGEQLRESDGIIFEYKEGDAENASFNGANDE